MSSYFVSATAIDDAANCSEYFIGLNSIANDSWQWTDKRTSSYAHWNRGKDRLNDLNKCDRIDCSSGSGQCVSMSTTGDWCNRNCASQMCFVCEIILSNTTTTTTG